MLRLVKLGLTAMVLTAVAGCEPDYSPNTYSSNAVQQANKVERAIVVGYRQVAISANGTVGAVAGGAAGGILGSQSYEVGVNSALGAVGGTVIGGIVGTAVEHVTSDTTGWEYIVRKDNGDLLSVTQREPTPLAIGQKVLVITGNQARVIADYSVPLEPTPKAADAKGAKEPADGKDDAAAKAKADDKGNAEAKENTDAKTAPSPAAAATAPTGEPSASTSAQAAANAAPATASPPPLVAASPSANEPPASSRPTPITPSAMTPAATSASTPGSAPEQAAPAETMPASSGGSDHSTP